MCILKRQNSIIRSSIKKYNNKTKNITIVIFQLLIRYFTYNIIRISISIVVNNNIRNITIATFYFNIKIKIYY